MQLLKGKRSRFLLLPFFIMALFLSCDQEEVSLKNNCILEEVQFDDFNKLIYTTISGGKIYQVRQEFTFDGETDVVASYQFTYFIDSLVVRNQLESTPTKLPFLSVKFDGDRILQVVKYFPSSDVRIVHDFDYSVNNRIRINLTRIASNGNSLFAAYANYYLDADGNVFQLESYALDRETASDFIKFEDRTFTYDSYRSPMKGMFLPFFAGNYLPDVKFFSTNNVLAIEENNETARYTYEYGKQDNTLIQFQPNGEPVFFSYVNCP